MTEKLKSVIEALQRNNFTAVYAETKNDILNIIKGLIPENSTL